MATSSTTSASAAIVSTLGAGSGVDWSTIAAQLSAAQFAGRTDRLTTKAETLDRQITAASTLKSALLSLASSLGDRVRAGDLSALPSVANAAVAKPSLSGAAQPAGTYSLEVTALAKGQVLQSSPYASGAAAVGAGTLTLRFGTIAGGAFTEDAAHAAANITIPSGATLDQAAAAINGARAGVSAYVAATPTGARLVLKGADGANQAFVLDVAEDPAEPGLAALAWTAGGDPARVVQGASDAAFTLDGVARTATGNTVTNVVPGLNLTLTGINPGAPTQISFADPAAAIAGAMQDLTAALNEIAGEVSKTTDPKTGDLARDDGARALKRAFSGLAGQVIMPNAAANAPRTLADLGLSIQRDGTFAFDAAKLTKAITADARAVSAMFTTGIYGVYASIDSIARRSASITDPGSLGGSISRYWGLKTKVATDTADLAEQQEALRARFVTRFAGTDTRVAASQSTLSFLQGQIAQWNKSTS